MSIKVTDNRVFKLDTKDTSYIFAVGEGNMLLHQYYGGYVSDDDLSYYAKYQRHGGVCPKPAFPTADYFSTDVNRMEYSVNGTGDYRVSALQIKDNDGHASTDIRYVGHKIYPGKPVIPGMPATYATEEEADTLEIDAIDAHTGALVTLFYTVFKNHSAITRHVRVKNTSDKSFDIERIYSACVDFYAENFELLHIYGMWGKERIVERNKLNHGIQTISSKRGCSSHNHNPFVALVSDNTTEDYGDVYGFNLVYTGNFSAEVELDSYETTRLIMGIESTDFNWLLMPGEEFYAPEVVMVYSGEGLGKMSRTFHKLYRNNLCRGPWKLKKRPILINNWEATYFNFNEEKLYSIAKEAKALGIEMLVMDDGWFGGRSDDKSSLGDWFVNEEKLKGGLKALVDIVNALDMKFGIWFEPEMISPISKLNELHPDWTIQIEGRDKSLSRNQCVLDMTREDVREYLFNCIKNVMDNANIEYIKWDFNRPLTEIGSALLPKERQKEYFHRYVLGLYELLERLTSAYPHLLIEGCASGGGRFDPAWLYYTPQIWTSDDTDAVERIDIQYGTSMCYPTSSMGAHVSACPNHQTKRVTSFKTRGDVAMFGTFGYELDITKLTDDEKELVKVQCENYHKYYNVIHNGDMYRLISPFERKRDSAAWMYVSSDKDEAIVFYGVIRTSLYMPHIIKLRGLDPAKKYTDLATGAVYSGDTLMNAGLNIARAFCDFETVIVHLKEC